jgi:hypothetical protein
MMQKGCIIKRLNYYLKKGGIHFYPAKNPEYMSLKKLLVSDEPVVFSLLDGIQS